MKFWFTFKVKEKILEIIRNSEIKNYSNSYIRSLSDDFQNLPEHVDFHLLLHDTYCECLGDYASYLYKGKRFNELQAAIYVITKVFQVQSETLNAHKEMRKLGDLGEMLSDGAIRLFVIAKIFLDENPEMFKPVFNLPDPSIYDDIEKATGLKHHNGAFIDHDEDSVSSTSISNRDQKIEVNTEISFDDHLQRFQEEDELLYGSDSNDELKF